MKIFAIIVAIEVLQNWFLKLFLLTEKKCTEKIKILFREIKFTVKLKDVSNLDCRRTNMGV